MKKELEATPTTLEEANQLLEIAKGEIKDNEKVIKEKEDSIAKITKERDDAQEASRKNFNAFINAAGGATKGIKADSEESKPLKVSDITITPRI